jgi:Flp pilus assembly pilin Flp
MHFTTPGLMNYSEAQVRLRMDKASDLARNGERGASAIEWVIISALLIAIVLAIGATIKGKLQTKATELNLDTP